MVKNFLRLISSFVVLFLMVAGCTPPTSAIQTAIAQTQQALPTRTLALTATSLPTPTQLPPPLTNSVYFGTAEGKNVIFVTESYQQNLFTTVGFESSPYLGSLYFEIGYQISVFNFLNLKDPQLLFSFPDLIQWWPVKYDLDQGERKYLSGIITRNTFPKILSFVYVVDLKTGDYQEIWTGEPAQLLFVYNEYLEISILSCYFCDRAPHPKTLIVNTVTGKTLELGEVGNVIVDVDDKTVRFQYLAPVEVPCVEDIQCLGVQYDPAGDVFVEILP